MSRVLPDGIKGIQIVFNPINQIARLFFFYLYN